MKPYDIILDDYSVCLLEEEKQALKAYSCSDSGLMVLTKRNQSMLIEAADEVPLFIGAKGCFLAGKAYSIDDALNEKPLKDFRAVLKMLNVKPENLQVVLGPSLTFSHIEQDCEVLARVNKMGYGLACKGTGGKFYLDLQVLVLLQMRALGIPMDNIHVSIYDTFDTTALKSALRGDKEKNRFIAVLH